MSPLDFCHSQKEKATRFRHQMVVSKSLWHGLHLRNWCNFLHRFLVSSVSVFQTQYLLIPHSKVPNGDTLIIAWAAYSSCFFCNIHWMNVPGYRGCSLFSDIPIFKQIPWTHSLRLISAHVVTKQDEFILLYYMERGPVFSVSFLGFWHA